MKPAPANQKGSIMGTARLMSRPEDLQKLGLTPGVVQPWEDGRRDTATPGHMEVWYFDATMDDGTKIVVGFRPINPAGNGGADAPNLNVNITTPDGQEFVDMIQVPAEDSSIASDHCEVRFGVHTAVGNLVDYDVHVEPVNGIGLDLHYHALVDPYRAGGTAQVALGEDDEFYYTDFSVPRSRVSGTVTAGGKTWEVEGEGYHDHQWFNISPFVAWHHWLWGRFFAENYTVVIYDFVTSEKFGFTRVPIFGVMDKSGKVIFDNRSEADVQVETYHDDQTDKAYPKRSRYTFHEDGTTAEFEIDWKQVIEVRDMYGATSADHYGMAGEKQRAAYDAMGIKPSYMRYYAVGKLTLTDAQSAVTTESGDMIYELNYPGVPDERAGL